ncbi:hypothetical protein LGT39_11855 [Demequina sp. TTPB684]|uniref:hypothetical protein n=1 Tax=unclassified Demequina TaxID=2620311 RepID=UPI001CF3D919|nr:MULTISPECIES: hypothetical protein [unclassified Demequina]MCB2413536.1 hypothetical protein [Demequina sp. TTPB684]UPU87243.1 hypothetical protein LGT36_008130 [Demequina sp. TMPB413]
MKHNKVLTTGLGLLIAVTGTIGLTGCSSNDGDKAEDSAVTAEVNVDVATDLQTARQAVLDALADDDWAQVMLASDVQEPTIKYGLMVMPFVATDAASRVTGTVTIEEGGNFVIEADSAATGETWQIDQDGTITQVTE